MSLNVASQSESGKIVLTVHGRLDGQNSELFTQDTDKLIGEGHGNYILDFSQVQYISSAGLRGILIWPRRFAGPAGV